MLHKDSKKHLIKCQDGGGIRIDQWEQLRRSLQLLPLCLQQMHQHRHVTGWRGKLLGRYVADGTEDFPVLFDVKRSLLDHFFSTRGRVGSLSRRRLEKP